MASPSMNMHQHAVRAAPSTYCRQRWMLAPGRHAFGGPAPACVHRRAGRAQWPLRFFQRLDAADGDPAPQRRSARTRRDQEVVPEKTVGPTCGAPRRARLACTQSEELARNFADSDDLHRIALLRSAACGSSRRRGTVRSRSGPSTSSSSRHGSTRSLPCARPRSALRRA